jgi:predicted nucleic acid-binding protein
MIAVLDVSAAVQIILEKEKAKRFKDSLDNSDFVFAPDLYVAELSNALWKYYKTKIFSEKECRRYIEGGINLIDEFVDLKEIWEEAFGESVKNNHPVYDMYYAALARKNDGTLITNDEDLAKICKKRAIRCVI